MSLTIVNNVTKQGMFLDSASPFTLPEYSSDFERVFAETVNFNVLH